MGNRKVLSCCSLRKSPDPETCRAAPPRTEPGFSLQQMWPGLSTLWCALRGSLQASNHRSSKLAHADFLQHDNEPLRTLTSQKQNYPSQRHHHQAKPTTSIATPSPQRGFSPGTAKYSLRSSKIAKYNLFLCLVQSSPKGTEETCEPGMWVQEWSTDTYKHQG